MAVIRFAFDQYLAMRKREHPDWSIRKLRNPRLYQGHLRSELRKFVSEIMPKMDQEYKPEYDGEAMGIDFASMFPAVGLTWVFPPQTYNYRVCLIAKRKQ